MLGYVPDNKPWWYMFMYSVCELGILGKFVVCVYMYRDISTNVYRHSIP